MSLSHEYFGKLNLNSYDVWTTEMTINGKLVAVQLSLDSDSVSRQNLLTVQTLDKCAAICQNIEQFDQQNREMLTDYLNNDREFMDDYLNEPDEYAGSEPLVAFYEGDKSISSFVGLLQVMQINLIINDTKTLIASDYMIDQNYSDQILCVYRKSNGDLMNIGAES